MEYPKLDGKFILAPMSGVSDVAFRVLCKRYGSAMTYTEFCSADGIVQGNDATRKLFYLDDEEIPVGVQLFGSTPETVRKAALEVEGTASVIDFNLGCPAWHVLKNNCGSALLANPDLIETLVKEVSSVLSTPFTVKLRLGLNDRTKNFVEVAKRCVSAGAVAVALHARTTKQGYSGKADWSAIKELKESIDVPVIGNGDVFTPEDAVRMLEETGCDYVMIGRGARNNPFIFRQANQLLETGSYDEISEEDQFGFIQDYIELAQKYELDFVRIKGHAVSMTKGIRNSSHLRQELVQTDTLEELQTAIEVFREG
jgi:nifR3 family TIM-barrel protein